MYKKRNKILYIFAFFIAISIFSRYDAVNAATLQINSSSNSLQTGETITLSVILDSAGVSINNSEATIVFPTDSLEVVSINKIGSIFTLWVEEPSFSNTTGSISFNGGVPTPGYVGSQGRIISITVKAKKTGQANLAFSSATVRANDGFGTNVLSNQQGKTLSILKTAEPMITTETVLVQGLQISSPTHPNQDQWYKDRDVVYQWIVPTGSDAIQTSISNISSSIPKVIYSPVISEKNVDNLEDGMWYFKVRARKDQVWGPTSTYIARIDNTPPQKKKVDFSYDDNTKILSVNANIQDLTSGIDRYEIFVNDVFVKKIKAEEFNNGNYNLVYDRPGKNAVKLIAIDRAGNLVDATGTFTTTGVLPPKLEPIPSVISSDEQLLIIGTSQNPNLEVVIKFRYNNESVVSIKTKSNPDSSFFTLTPKLKTGIYDIWAEVGSGDSAIQSEHLRTEATSRLLITIGSQTVTAFSLLISIVAIITLLIILAYYLGHRYSRFQHRLKMRTALVKSDNSKILVLLRKRLEKHLVILQRIRKDRVLTDDEKEIKEAIEGDLDEVDKAMAE